MAMRRGVLGLFVLCCAVTSLAGAADGGYLQPPEPLLSVMRAPLNPALRLDPTGKTLLLLARTQYPPIARVAEPYLKLAGVRVEPRTHNRHDRSNGYGIRTCLDGLSLLDIASGRQMPVALPEGACPAPPLFSPDGQHFAFENTVSDHVELWVGDVASGKAHRIEGVALNPVLGQDIQWLGDRSVLLVKAVPEGQGPAPVRSQVPTGPEVSESLGGKGESSSYEARDTLKSPEDDALFDYYAGSQLATVDVGDDRVVRVGKTAVYTDVDAAPDGRHVRVESLKRPYSRVTTYGRFAHDVAVLDLADGSLRMIATFAFGKADLSAAGKDQLDKNVIAKLGSCASVKLMLITGHTDRIGSHAANQKLSEKRADTVKAYLASKGAKADAVETMGAGKTQPVPGVKCDDKLPRKKLIECLAPNRRVVIEVQGPGK